MPGRRSKTARLPNSNVGGSPSHREEKVREENLAKMAQLMRRGYTQSVIARELGISQAQVSYDWKQLRQELRESRADKDVKDAVDLQLEQLAEVKMEAWRAWEKSKEDARRVEQEEWPVRTCVKCDGKGQIKVVGPSKAMTTCLKCGGKGETGGPGKAVTEVEGRLPGHQYLEAIIKCLKEEAELLMLYPEKTLKLKGGLNNTSQFVDWTGMMKMLEGGVPDAVEAKIAAALEVTGASDESTGVAEYQ
jgi:predicted transcriptional regulator